VPALEFVRFDGKVTCFGLPLVRFTTEERLDEIIRIHEDNGCPIFNPHRYTLEEGGMKQTDEVQLAFKREADPKGLLNPGKMIAWETRTSTSLGTRLSVPGLQATAGGGPCASSSSTPTRSKPASMRRAAPARRGAASRRPRGRRLRPLRRGFDPVMSRQERLDYHDESACTTAVQRLCRPAAGGRGAGALHPVWNFGYPAILKGFFDRVFLPGVSFHLVDGKVRRRTCTTSASSRR
jgi:hypothetical protein